MTALKASDQYKIDEIEKRKMHAKLMINSTGDYELDEEFEISDDELKNKRKIAV